MPTTTNYALPYPDVTDPPDGPAQIQGLAEAVETALNTVYAGIEFGGAVAVGGNLSTAGTMTVSSTSALNGNVTVSGTVAATGDVSSDGDIQADGGFYAGSLFVPYLVKGRVHTGALVDTSTTDSVNWSNISSSNLLNVPVVAGHAYRADYQVEVTSSVANDRIRYALWNGTVGDTQLGNFQPIARIETITTYRVQTFSFIWQAPDTETIANLNLGMIRYSGTGTVTTRVGNTMFMAMVYDLGPSAPISNL